MVRPRIAARSPALHQRRSQEDVAVYEQKWNVIRSGQQYLNKIATQSAAFLYVIAVDGGEKGTKFKPTGTHRFCETTTAQFLDQDASGVSLQEKPVADRGGNEASLKTLGNYSSGDQFAACYGNILQSHQGSRMAIPAGSAPHLILLGFV